MESEVVARTAEPATAATLTGDLESLGVADGMTVLVHSSLSQLGWIAGGAHAVLLALLAAVGDRGTLMMPTHTGLSDPSTWQRPAVPPPWWPLIRAGTPAYDPHLTPTRGMGAVVERFRNLPGVRRSAHPAVSFAARGPGAGYLLAPHDLEDSLGEESPLGRLYALHGAVLLLGVDHANNTSLHLAEHRAAFPAKRREGQGAPMLVDGVTRWVEYSDLDYDESGFAPLGEDFARDTGAERTGPVGVGTGRLMEQRAVVDYGVGWLERNRATPGSATPGS